MYLNALEIVNDWNLGPNHNYKGSLIGPQTRIVLDVAMASLM